MFDLQALQKQLGARLSSRNAVVKAGRQLMKDKTGEAKALLKKKLQSLEKEWEKVCQVSVDRQDKLEDAYMKIGQFRSVHAQAHREESRSNRKCTVVLSYVQCTSSSSGPQCWL